MKKSFYSFSLELALSLSSNEVVVVTFHQEYIQSYIQDTWNQTESLMSDLFVHYLVQDSEKE